MPFDEKIWIICIIILIALDFGVPVYTEAESLDEGDW